MFLDLLMKMVSLKTFLEVLPIFSKICKSESIYIQVLKFVQNCEYIDYKNKFSAYFVKCHQ